MAPVPALPEYTTVDELEVEWREFDEDERLTAAARLSTAATILRGEYPDLDERVLAGRLSGDVVGFVLRDMVRRSMQTAAGGSVPEGATSLTRTTGPFSTSFGFGEAAPRDGALYLSKANRRLLGGGRDDLYVIDLI